MMGRRDEKMEGWEKEGNGEIESDVGLLSRLK